LQLSWMPMKPKVGGLNHCADKKFFSKKLSWARLFKTTIDDGLWSNYTFVSYRFISKAEIIWIKILSRYISESSTVGKPLCRTNWLPFSTRQYILTNTR
jgi:hypothetical protein